MCGVVCQRLCAMRYVWCGMYCVLCGVVCVVCCTVGVISISPRSVNRDIIAGVAVALGGLTAPYERFDTQRKMLIADFLWANG